MKYDVVGFLVAPTVASTAPTTSVEPAETKTQGGVECDGSREE
jgi:hypothetical protein